MVYTYAMNHYCNESLPEHPLNPSGSQNYSLYIYYNSVFKHSFRDLGLLTVKQLVALESNDVDNLSIL